jgi:uncharacterized YigZ family protein
MGIKMQIYKTIKQDGEGEIVEKKSRFLGKIKKVETEEEALEFIESIKKQYWDARHNCFAYIIGTKGETVRCSDDGEPSGTAGKPMLEVLQNQELRNVVVVVTRYFGGVLLGTGGLVRAYTQATQEALKEAQVATMTPMFVMTVRTDYNAIGKIKYVLAQEEIPVLNEEYAADVVVTIAVPQNQKDSMIKKLTEVTNGRAVMEEKEQTFMAL